MIRPRFEGIPTELTELRQWILWRKVLRGGKEVKLPWSVYDQPASTTDPETWHEFECVVMRYDEQRHAGIGFVFVKGGGYTGIDLDSCRDPKSGVIMPWAQRWIDRSNTYTEISPSGTGVKMWLRTTVDIDKGRNIKINEAGTDPQKAPGVEMYTHGRYFAMTGHVINDFGN